MGPYLLLSLLKLFGIISLVHGDDNSTEVEEINLDLNPRIVGGRIGSRKQFPYLVLLDCHSLTGTRICGGSLLNKRWVLSAGHCVYDRKYIDVHLGAHKLYNEDNEKGRIKLKTDTWILHEKYVHEESQNDIALIHLPEKISYTNNIKQVRLKVKPLIPYTPAHKFVGSGYGYDSFESPSIQRPIRFGIFSPLSRVECNKIMEILQVSNPTAICCKSKSGDIGGYGDSGGPVVLAKNKLQIGIFSFLNRPGGQTMLTDVTAYIDWIEQNIGNKFLKEI